MPKSLLKQNTPEDFEKDSQFLLGYFGHYAPCSTPIQLTFVANV